MIVAKGSLEGVERQLNTLRSASKRVEECKVQVEQAKITNGESLEEVSERSPGVNSCGCEHGMLKKVLSRRKAKR